MTTRALHILNPSRRFRDSVKNAVSSFPAGTAVWVQREHPAHIETIVRWGLQEGFRSFIVWGGDGSFHRVVQSFRDLDLWTKAETGLVPVGTCNDLARHLGLTPGDIPGALKDSRNSQTTAIDVGLASWSGPRGKKTEIFINNAGFGRPPEAIQNQWGPVRNVFDFKAHRLRIEGGGLQTSGDRSPLATGKTVEGRFLMGVICNGPFFNGGLHFSADTSCSDGRLDGFFTRETNRAVLLGRLAMGRLGRPLSEAGVTRVNAGTIKIISEEPLCLQADGETLEKEGAREMEFSIMPNKLSFSGELETGVSATSKPAGRGVSP